MDIAIERLHHFKLVNWVGIHMSWEQLANEENTIEYFKMEIDDAVIDAIRAQIQRWVLCLSLWPVVQTRICLLID